MIARYLLRHGRAQPNAPEESRAEWPVLADPLDVFDLPADASPSAAASETAEAAEETPQFGLFGDDQ